MAKIADFVFSYERDDFSWEPTAVVTSDIDQFEVQSGIQTLITENL